MDKVEMNREADVVRSLVDLADVLTNDYDVVDLLTLLSGRCVDVLAVSTAGVCLAPPPGSLRVVASSVHAMRLLDLFVVQQADGPVIDPSCPARPVPIRPHHFVGGRVFDESRAAEAAQRRRAGQLVRPSPLPCDLLNQPSAPMMSR